MYNYFAEQKKIHEEEIAKANNLKQKQLKKKQQGK